MKGKKLRLWAFIAMTAAVMTLAGAWLRPKDDPMYAEPESSVDVAIMGTSLAYCTVNPLLLYRDYGIASYCYAKPLQPLNVTYYYLSELFKTQKPKLIMIENFAFCYGDDSQHAPGAGIAAGSLYGIRFSANYLKIMASCTRASEWPLYLIPAVFYHNAWSGNATDPNAPTVTEGRSDFKGAYCVWEAEYCGEPDLGVRGGDQRWETGDVVRKTFGRIVELCREHGAELMIFMAPLPIDESAVAMSNSCAELCRQWNVPYVDLTLQYEALGIDMRCDTSDNRHLNAFGQEKTTAYLGAYLKEHYDLADRRGGEDEAEWARCIALYESIRAEAAPGIIGPYQTGEKAG